MTFLNLLDSRTVLDRVGLVGWYDSSAETVFEPNGESFNSVAGELSGRTIRGGVRVSSEPHRAHFHQSGPTSVSVRWFWSVK